MDEELILEGNNYIGRFLAVKKEGKFWEGSEYAEHLEDQYWWEGVGIISNNKTKEEHRFLLKTENDRFGKEISLEHSILMIYRPFHYHYNRPEIIDEKKVNDLELELMYNDAKNREEKEIIPRVKPIELKYEELIESGLVAEDSGQIKFNLINQEIHVN